LNAERKRGDGNKGMKMEREKKQENTCLHAGKRKERRKLRLSFVVEWKRKKCMIYCLSSKLIK